MTHSTSLRLLRRPPLVIAALLLLGGCLELRPIDVDGTCGNGVLEPLSGEDCDTATPFDDGRQCGSPTSEAACRFRCGPLVGDGQCPQGWSCGVDGICRAPSGQMGTPQLITAPGDDLLSSDFDGDGRCDLVGFGTGGIVASFAERAGELRVTDAVPTGIVDRPPVAGDLTGDGVPDLVVPTTKGAQLYKGSATKRLLPLMIPALQKADVLSPPKTLTLRTTNNRNFSDVLFAEVVDGNLRFFLDDAEAELAPGSDSLLTLTQAQFERVAIANVDAPGTPDEFAIADASANRVLIAGANCPLPPPTMPGMAPADLEPCSLEVLQVAALPEGMALVDGKTWLGFVDDAPDPTPPTDGGMPDGGAPGGGAATHALDLLVNVQVGDEVKLAVASIDETGTLGAFSIPASLDGLTSCRGCRPTERSGFRDIADVDGDGLDDFITRDGIYRAIAPGVVSANLEAQPFRPWRDVLTVDLNRDGVNDVIGYGPYSLDIITSVAGGAFVTREIDVGDEVSAVEVGDYDGDGHVDVALLQAPNRISVLFGSETGPSIVRQVVLDAPGVAGLVTKRGSDRSDNQSGDGIDDLVVTVQQAEQGAIYFELEGAPSRGMLAGIERQGRVYVGAAIGSFVAPESNDLILAEIAMVPGQPPPAPGMPPPPAFFLARGDAFQSLLPVDLQYLSVPDECVLPDDFDAVLTPIDLDDDGVNELLVAEGSFSQSAVGPLDRDLLVLALDDADEGLLSCTNLSPVNSAGGLRAATAADLDGDGEQELLALLQENPGPTTPMPPPAELIIWWGATADPTAAPDRHTLPSGFAHGELAVAELDGTPGSEVLVLIAADVHRLDITQEGVTRTLLNHNQEGAAELTVGDFDGDGLDDIAVGSEDVTLVYRQLPCDAADAARGRCERKE